MVGLKLIINNSMRWCMNFVHMDYTYSPFGIFGDKQTLRNCLGDMNVSQIH